MMKPEDYTLNEWMQLWYDAHPDEEYYTHTEFIDNFFPNMPVTECDIATPISTVKPYPLVDLFDWYDMVET